MQENKRIPIDLSDKVKEYSDRHQVDFVKVHLILTCRVCSKQWGVSVTKNSPPETSFICYNCKHNGGGHER